MTDHGVMRRLNRELVLRHLREHSPSSRISISTATGLAKPTVSAIVDELVADGLISELGRGQAPRSGGRPPHLLSFNARSAFIVGVHVGVRRTTVVAADALGAELASTTIPTPHESPGAALELIAKVVRRTLADGGADAHRVEGAGICLPGLVSGDHGRLLHAPNLGWRDVPVAGLLEQELGIPVAAHNAAHTSLVAEAAEGAAVGAADVVLFYAGSGVGAAVMSGGRIVSSERGIAGEIGHGRVRPDGARCNCGKTGCLETVASAHAVAEEAARRWRKGAGKRSPLEPALGFTDRDVSAAAAEGDREARSVLEAAGASLGAVGAWLVNIFDPSVMVLAGSLFESGSGLVDSFRAAVAADVLPSVGDRVRITPARLGQSAEVRGVLLLARERVERRMHAGL